MDDHDVAWGGWWFEREGVRAPLPDLMPAWDYSVRDRIGLNVDIDAMTVREKTGIENISDLEVVALVDCPSTLKRFVHRSRLAPHASQEVEVVIDLPPGEVAHRLDVAAFLLLATDLPPKSRTASRSGSRLATGPSRRVLLEGDASRFPTEAVSFASLNWADVPWTLNAVFFDLSDSFMGSVRLLVNEDHPLGRAVLSAEVDPATDSRLKLEVLRTLVGVVAAQENLDHDDYPPESIGEVVASMCSVFLNRTLAEAVHIYQRDPIKFDRLLYAGVASQ
ncbi:hypothetical protein GCM10009812_04830 [Nocardioides marinus]|uniref:Uncharacterized protein n=1 Tax=Nocardioides marinus TaxID=374514 RepID=A0A7Y9YD13_9ACTN|nr:hypothetical protein [Nocardioides marinus]NYI08997.1 hypothetical protein [Nocardioides marinus]